MKTRRIVALCVGVVLLLSAVVLVAQDSKQQIKIKPGVMQQAAQIRTLQVQAPPEVVKVLASKRQANVQLIQRSLTYRGNIPVLQLQGGKQVALLPVDEPVQPSPALRQQSAKSIEEISKMAPYYRHIMIDPAVIGALLGRVVDHRGCQTPIRDQGDRGTCTAFASMAGLEAFESCKNKRTVDLSEQHAYHTSMAVVGSTCCSDPGVATYMTASYLTSHRVCNESQWPYMNHTAVCASDSQPAACTSGARYGFTDTQVILGTAYGGPADQNANNVEYLESLLKAGYDIVYGTHVAGSDWSDGTAESGVVDVQMVGGSPAPSYGGHAMLIVGYDRPNKYFIFKNSWGAGHGHSGYFHISYDYVRTYGKYGYIIKAIAD